MKIVLTLNFFPLLLQVCVVLFGQIGALLFNFASSIKGALKSIAVYEQIRFLWLFRGVATMAKLFDSS